MAGSDLGTDDHPRWRSPRRCCSSSARRSGCSRCSAAIAVTGVVCPVGHRAAPARPLPRPGCNPRCRPARQRLPGAARPVRPRQRWLVGTRSRREPGEVGLAARGAHRLHLRGHRRGARPDRDARCARCCSRSLAYAGLRIALRVRRPVRPAGRRVARRPGSRRRRCVNIGAVLGLLPDHRRAAAAGLLRRLRAARPRWWRWACCCRFARTEPGAAGPGPAGRPRCCAWPRRGVDLAATGAVTRGCTSCSPAAAPPATSSPRWPSPTRCARRDPAIGVTALGTARGLETRLVPARGYDLALIPPVPIPRTLPAPTCCAVPAPAARRGRAPSSDVLAPDRGRRASSGFGGYVAAPGLPRRPAAARALSSCTRRTPAPGLANRLGRAVHPVRRRPRSRARCRTRGTSGMPLRPRGRDARPGRAAGPRRGRVFGLDPDRPTLLVFGGSQGARRLNDAVGGRRARDLRRGRRPGAARGRPARTTVRRAAAAPRRPAVRRRALPRPDGAGLRRRRPRAVPCRGHDRAPS